MKKTHSYRVLVQKKIMLILIMILFSPTIVGQNHEEVNLIDLDSTWGKEVFPFPIRFAQNIDYQGIEEARFPPEGWSNENHENFWSYTFAWSIDLDRKITGSELERDLEKYFDGLVGTGFIEENKQYKASSMFIKTEDNAASTLFKGKINTYDGFTTKKAITLHIIVKSHYCEKEKKSIILFLFSPKEYNHPVWNTLNKIRLTKNFCEN